MVRHKEISIIMDATGSLDLAPMQCVFVYKLPVALIALHMKVQFY